VSLPRAAELADGRLSKNSPLVQKASWRRSAEVSGEITRHRAEAHDGRATPRHTAPVTADDAVAGRRA